MSSFNLSRIRLRLVPSLGILFVPFFLVTACGSLFPRKVSHEGFRVVIPGDWVDFTPSGFQGINVGSKWEKGYLVVEKIPGKSAFALDLLEKGAALEPKIVTKENLSQWYQFTGSGYRFRRYDRNGEVFQENVIFSRVMSFPATMSTRQFSPCVQELKRNTTKLSEA